MKNEKSQKIIVKLAYYKDEKFKYSNSNMNLWRTYLEILGTLDNVVFMEAKIKNIIPNKTNIAMTVWSFITTQYIST